MGLLRNPLACLGRCRNWLDEVLGMAWMPLSRASLAFSSVLSPAIECLGPPSTLCSMARAVAISCWAGQNVGCFILHLSQHVVDDMVSLEVK